MTAARLFRVVFASDSSLRLMEKAADDPATWRVVHPSGPVRQVSVRDLVVTEQGLPRHTGLEYSVDLEAEDIDRSVEDARSWAESLAFILAAAKRAPVSNAVFQLAYEITPGVEERDFRQTYWDPPIPISKPAVDPAVFGALRDRLDELASEPGARRLVERSVLSLSWFRQALDETDPLFRFHKLWVAVEALNPLLDEHFGIPEENRRGFQGLRQLAASEGLGSDWISAPLGVRRSLYHSYEARPGEIRERTKSLMESLEGLCIAAWRLLLKLGQDFPPMSIVPHPLSVILHGHVIQKDESVWGPGHHPFVRAEFIFEAVEPNDPREVTFKMSAKYTPENTGGFRPTGQGVGGPAGYQPLTMEGDLRVDEPPATG